MELQTVKVKKTTREKLNSWLNKENHFFTTIADFSVTNKVVLYINSMALFIMLSAGTVETNLPLSTLFAVFVGLIFYKFKKNDEKY